MSADANPMDKKIENASEALEFLKQTFYDANLILNPDLGFLKADNSSAFDNIHDEVAQFAQLRLVECEEILSEMSIDLWEICMEFHIFKTHLDYAQAFIGHSKLFTEEWVAILRNYHDEQFEGRYVSNMSAESEEEREYRRKSHAFTLITKLHGLHPSLAHTQTHMQFENKEALLICESLLPQGWTERISEVMQEVHGANDFQTSVFQSSFDDIPEKVKNSFDDMVMGIDDYDDEKPIGW